MLRPYAYNGDGVLVGDGTTTYAQDLAAPLSQVLSDGTATYVYGRERLTANAGGGQTWYVSDALGSVRQTLDDAGGVLGSMQYDPWGVPTAGTPQPFGFTGELHSAGQVYLRARWYAPGQGTFTSRDPFAGFPTQPASLHPYQYAAHNPTRYTDPSGAFFPLVIGGVVVLTAVEMAFLITAIGLSATIATIEICINQQQCAGLEQAIQTHVPWKGGTVTPPLDPGPPEQSGYAGPQLRYPSIEDYTVRSPLTGPEEACWVLPGPMLGAQPWPFTTGAPGEQVDAPLVWMARPGYSGPDQGYVNNKPDDLQPGKPYKTLQEAMANPDVRPLIGEGGITYAAKYIYVITGQGEIRIASHKTHHHPDLVDGNNVYGAGQIFLDNAGTITSIDDQSGHYFPRDGTIFGPAFFDYMHYLLTQAGIVVSKDVFDTY